MIAEILQAIKDCGAAEMPISETCEIVEISREEFEKDKEAVQFYRMGQLETKLKIQQAVVRMGREGVPQMVQKYFELPKEVLTVEDSLDLSRLDLDGVDLSEFEAPAKQKRKRKKRKTLKPVSKKAEN